MSTHLRRSDRRWRLAAVDWLAAGLRHAWPVVVVLLGLTLVRCSERQALLLTVTATEPVESFDLKVRDLATGALVLVTAGEKVTTPEDPNRNIADPEQALKVAIEFDKVGDYLLHMVGRIGQGSDRLMVAVRHFRVTGTHEVRVKLIPLEHDEDGDLFPACFAYGACDLHQDALSCEYLDCNDADPFTNPLAEKEICGNGKDEDCSALCAGGGGSAGDAPCVDADGDGSPEGEDCDDQDPCAVPGLVEAKNLCELSVGDFPALPNACLAKLDAEGKATEPPYCGDGIDQDCSGQDVDCETDEDCDGSPVPADCNDKDPTIHPGAPEKCDGVDNNCDDVIDEGCIPCDADGDGYAVDEVQDPSCTVPKGDCDDYDAGIHPATTEGSGGKEGGTATIALRGYCHSTVDKNGTAERDVDHDCDGQPARDDGCPAVECDADGDGFAAASCNPPPPRNLEDCNPGDPTVYPGAPDKCGDGVAQNCVSDQPCDGDRDGDGYVGPADCNDSTTDVRAAQIRPWATEICDGLDNDCDGVIDEGNPDHQGDLISTLQPSCSDHAEGQCWPCPGDAVDCADEERRLTGTCVCSRQRPSRDPKYVLDSRARVVCSGEDEADVASQRCFGANQPQAEECDRRDWDCDGQPDDPDGSNLADALAQRACSNNTGRCRSGLVVGCDLDRSLPNYALLRQVLGSENINEHWLCSSDTVLPVPELCNGLDDDCNASGSGDDGLPSNEQDRDRDGYLACSGCRSSSATGHYALRTDLAGCDDCEDGLGAVFPGAREMCNAVDDNCSRSSTDPLGLADDGKDHCTGATPDCCTNQPACRNLSNDTSNCGNCGESCNFDEANRCLNGNCVCGNTGGPCPSDLNCVNVSGSWQCRCVPNGRCAGCCDGNTCRSSTTDHCGLRGAACDSCPDSNSCTTDSCQGGLCVNAPVTSGTSCDSNTGRCTDGNPPVCCKGCLDGSWDCQTGNTTSDCGSAGESCDRCTAPECQAAVCDSSRNCTTSNVGGTCTADSYSCTADVCSGGACTHPINSDTCLISGTCYDVGRTRPGNVCEICSSSSRTSWSDNNGASCTSDSLSCTNDVCSGGSCVHPLQSSFCLIDDGAGDVCVPDGNTKTGDDCSICDEVAEDRDWSPNHGVSCTVPVPKDCLEYRCNGFNCQGTTVTSGCFISGSCYAHNERLSAGDCHICDESTPNSWTVAASCTESSTTSVCADDFTCCINDCLGSDGTCKAGNQQTACGRNEACEDCRDGNDCTVDRCVSYSCDSTQFEPEGTACQTGVGVDGLCDDSGNCVP